MHNLAYLRTFTVQDPKLSNPDLSGPGINLFLYIFAFAYLTEHVKEGQFK